MTRSSRPATRGPEAFGSRTSRASGCRRRTTRTTTSGRSAGSSSSGTGPCSDTDVEENTGVARTVRDGDRLAGAARRREPTRSCSGSTCSARTGRGTRPSPIATSTPPLEPDEFEADEEGDLVEEVGEEEEIDIEEVPVLIDVPAGAVGDVLDEAELFRLRRTYAGTVTLVDRWLGELFDALQADGPAGRHAGHLHQRPGGAAGRARLRPPVPPLALRGADPHAADHPHARRQARRAAGIRRSCRRSTCCPRSSRPSAFRPPADPPIHGHDLLPLIRGEQTKVRDYACMGMDVEEFAIRTHLWHLIVPLESDPDEPRSSELYRKPEDRWDQNNVIEQHPEVADHLELALRRFVEAVGRDALEDLLPLRDIARFGAQ